MTSKEIRNQFFEFFKSKEHKIVQSAPVIPFDDPTLLFTNAGMNQFKDVFLGKGKRDYTRAANTQKCIRVSGKHNDLEEVGHDTYHHTFFEMLGNWSFGDYYKKEAIIWAWELLTEVWKLPKERLWATVFRTDDEAFEIWEKETDINPAHILRFNEKDNFWEMGETGPCGPSSEIHINLGQDYDNPEWVNAGDPRCIELWNLVFIQYNRDENGILTELPQKHIDTGMGFERIVAVLQNKQSNYDTDIFMPLIEAIEELSGEKYLGENNQVAMRVIADHIRTLTFAIADGASPGNEGRSYVLRRILRRAARYGRKIGFREPFLYKLVDVVVNKAGGGMGEVFPEIKENQDTIERIIKSEEETFNVTLDRGLTLFEEVAKEVTSVNTAELLNEIYRYKELFETYGNKNIVEKLDEIYKRKDELSLDELGEELQKLTESTKESKLDELSNLLLDFSKKANKYISGEEIFKLYDTFGFPVDLVELLAREKGLRIDFETFNNLMEKQKQRARESTKKKIAGVYNQDELASELNIDDIPETIFVGYEGFISTSQLLAYIKKDNKLFLIFDRSPFYVESGGQVNDQGFISINEKFFEVIDLIKIKNRIIHVILADDDIDFKIGENAVLRVNEKIRWDIMRNHSATHLLHATLRKILGNHVKQAGSYVGPDRLRFDFSHFQKVTKEEQRKIEEQINSLIRKNIAMKHHRDIPFEEAKKMGALMFFGDKYGDKVNVVQFGDYSMEFCGGTHVRNTSEINMFKIIHETAVASGVRRIEAVTGFGVEKYIYEKESELENAKEKISELINEKKKLEKSVAEFELKSKLGSINSVLEKKSEVSGINVYASEINAKDMNELKSFGDELRNKIKNGVGLLVANFGEKVGMVCVVTDDLIKGKNLSAGKLVGSAAKIIGGGGGGRNHLATAGGKDASKIKKAIQKFPSLVNEFLK